MGAGGHGRLLAEALEVADDVRVLAIEEPMVFGADAADAYGFLETMGIVGWLTEDLDASARAQALDQLRSTVEAHEQPGGVAFGSSAWLITARPAPIETCA